MSDIRAVIMAGGQGTRLKSLNSDIPKPMFPILGKPIIEYQIDSLKRSNIVNIIIVVGYLKESIIDYFGNGKEFGVTIEYVVEETPLGTAGAFFYLKEKLKDDFLFLFGDLILDIDFNRFVDFHKTKGAYITLFTHPNSHPQDSDVIICDDNDRVTGILKKNENRAFDFHNLVNSGIYCVKPESIQIIKSPEKTDFERVVLTNEIEHKRAFSYKSTEYVKDMGTPQRLEDVTLAVRNGIVKSKCLKHKQKAIFLDRDGTINYLKGFLKNVDDFELLEGVDKAIKRINESEYICIVITNQPVIARGECSFAELDSIHKKMETELGNYGAYIDDLFFCPHHPDRGFEGEIPELKIDCDCRKPKTGMIKKAAEKYNIDLASSWMIGDSTIDIQTGHNAGVKTVLVKTGMAGKDGKFEAKPDLEAENLQEAISKIIG